MGFIIDYLGGKSAPWNKHNKIVDRDGYENRNFGDRLIKKLIIKIKKLNVDRIG